MSIEVWLERWERAKWAVLRFLRHPDTYMFVHRNHYDDLIPGLPLPIEYRRKKSKERMALINEHSWEMRNEMIARYEREHAAGRDSPRVPVGDST